MSVPRIEPKLFDTGVPLDYENAQALFGRIQKLIDARYTNPALECSTAALWPDVLTQALLKPGESLATGYAHGEYFTVVGENVDIGDMITVIAYPHRMRAGELEIRLLPPQ